MNSIVGYHVGEAVRVRVEMSPYTENRKFSIDPEITSFEMLQSLLAKIYDIEGDFIISYLNRDNPRHPRFVTLAADWDLDVALDAASQPFLQLRVERLPPNKGLEEWDIITPIDIPSPAINSGLEKPSFAGTLLTQVEKTFNFLQKAFHKNENNGENNLKRPMTNAEFLTYLDGNGCLIRPKELRLSVYQGGIEPCLRPIVWKHILNAYPENLTQSEQLDYLAKKSEEYEKFKTNWKFVQSHAPSEKLNRLTNNIWKDVLRTDRTHKYYSGTDNQHLISLFNILTTYSLNHPSVSYCQGMSDILSPLLVVMKHEGHTYLCFCALMERLKPNFQQDGHSMTTKFSHLSLLLQYYDPEFYHYVQKNGATDLIFCYRWLLLELKREFAFDDALYMLEVLWSSLPPSPPRTEISLRESTVEDISESVLSNDRNRHSSGYETSEENCSIKLSWKENYYGSNSTVLSIKEQNHITNCLARDLCDCFQEGTRKCCFDHSSSRSNESYDCFHAYPPVSKESEGYISEDENNSDEYYCLAEKCAFLNSAMPDYSPKDRFTLLNPQDLGAGNPFLLFLCLTILLQHRDVVLEKQMDYNDMAMHFDKLVRKHNVQTVLTQARNIFAEYLRLGWQESTEDFNYGGVRS